MNDADRAFLNRLAERTVLDDGCLVLQAKPMYPSVRRNGMSDSLHRQVWRVFVGEPTPGLTIDHRCYIKACWNISHLEEVTRAENSRRHRRPAPPTPEELEARELRRMEVRDRARAKRRGEPYRPPRLGLPPDWPRYVEE